MTSYVLHTQESHLVASLPTCYQQVVFYTHKNHILLQVYQHVTNKLCFTHTRITSCCKSTNMLPTSCVLHTQESHLVASLATCYQQVVFYTHKNHILLQVCQHVTNKLCFTHTRITSCCKSGNMLPTSYVLHTQESHLVASLPTCYQQVVFYTHKNHILLQVCQHVTNKLCFTHTRITSCCKSGNMLPTSCVCTACPKLSTSWLF
jgi:predicted ATPase